MPRYLPSSNLVEIFFGGGAGGYFITVRKGDFVERVEKAMLMINLPKQGRRGMGALAKHSGDKGRKIKSSNLRPA